jgi:ribonuclease BN (tRNA processing enzyme)
MASFQTSIFSDLAIGRRLLLVLGSMALLGAAQAQISAPASTLTAAPAAATTPAPASPPTLEMVVLGSGGPGATGRAGASYAVLLDGKPRILVDAGPGAFVRAGEAKLNLAELDTVLLTHLHIDHAGGLPGLVKARAVSTRGAITFNVFGPAGRVGKGQDGTFPSTSSYIDSLFGKLGAFGYISNFSAPITFKATNLDAGVKQNMQPKIILQTADLQISAIAGHHRDAPAVIYRIDYKGKSITFTGDIDPEGHADLRRIASKTDLLVFNSVVLDPPNSPAILYTLHTAPQDIGLLAKDIAPGKLLLSHLSPVIERERDAVEKSIRLNYSGPLELAQDGLRVLP